MNTIRDSKMLILGCLGFATLLVVGCSVVCPSVHANGWGGGYSKGSVVAPTAFAAEGLFDEEGAAEANPEGDTPDQSIATTILPISARVKMLAEQCVSGLDRGFYTADDFCDMIPRILGLDPTEVVEIVSQPNGSVHLQVIGTDHEAVEIILP